MLKALRVESSLRDIKTILFWRAILAELLGTFFLIFILLGTTINKTWESSAVLLVSLTSGLTAATVIWSIGHVSGGHLNPAVTISFLITRRISGIRALFYVIAQCCGSIIAAWLLSRLLRIQSTGVTRVSDIVTNATGAIFIELFITFGLVMTVYATCDGSRRGFLGSGPLAIGLAVTVGHFGFTPFTGASMNPARSFGPALVYNVWDNQGVYWIGPLLGGIIAGIIYETIFAEDVSVTRTSAMFLSSTFELEIYEKSNVHKNNPEALGLEKQEFVSLQEIFADN